MKSLIVNKECKLIFMIIMLFYLCFCNSEKIETKNQNIIIPAIGPIASPSFVKKFYFLFLKLCNNLIRQHAHAVHHSLLAVLRNMKQ